jgi:hypothetical protein
MVSPEYTATSGYAIPEGLALKLELVSMATPLALSAAVPML